MQVSELTLEQLEPFVAKAQGLETFSGDDGKLYYHPGHNLPPRRWNPTHY